MESVDTAWGRERDLGLARAVLEMAQAGDLPELMRIARAAARALTGADGATLVLREGEQCRYADEDAIGPLWKGHRFPLTSCISGWVMLRDEAVVIGDIYADPRIPHEAYRPTFVRSLSMAPIRRGEPMGAIGCYWARLNGADEDVLRVQQILADAVALAFENMEVRRRLAVARAHAGDATVRAASGSSETLQVLQESEARYRLLVEQAPDGIFVADSKGCFLDANESGARMLGYSRDEILTRCIADIVVPEEIVRIPAVIDRLAGGAVVTSEWRLLRKDGSTFPGEVGGRRLPDGRLQGILRDVSERRRAEAAMRESESFYRQTLESIPGMVFTTRPDGDCDYSSQQWADYTGVPMTEHLGDGWNALLHPEDRARALAAWRDAVAERAPYDLDYRVRRHDGAYEWFRVIGRPIRNDLCGVARWFGVGMNIERLKQAEEQRIATLARQRDALVREVHHRIKNHLQGVTGLLRAAMTDSPRVAQPLEKAIARIHAIAQVHGLQGCSDGGRLSVLDLIHAAAGGAAGPVQIERLPSPAESPPAILGDNAVAIALVVNELVINALKHRQTGGEPRPVRVLLEVAARTARIVIRNGPARLPPGFDFARGKGIGNGLELAASLLPSKGAELVIRQDGDDVEAGLTLSEPALAAS